MGNFVAAFLIIGLVALIFITPVYYAMGVYEISYKGKPVGSELVQCIVPVWNVSYAQGLYDGGKSYIITQIFLILACIFEGVCLGFDLGYVLNIVSLGVLALAVLAFIIQAIYCTFIVINDTKACSLPKTILMAVFYPIGQYYIGAFLPKAVENMNKGDIY